MHIEKVQESIDLLIEKTQSKSIIWSKLDNAHIRIYSLSFPDKSEVRLSKVIRHTSSTTVNIQFYNSTFDLIFTDSISYSNSTHKVVQLFDAIETQYFKKDETLNSILDNLRHM
jgi:hypothetical protein